MNYVATIGLEVHVQLKTRSKMFCASPVQFGAEPNTHTCPVCLGLPGALPVMNQEALRMTLQTGLMLGCDIAPVSKFDRKNYFYPDMPKNYQISQYDMPLCTNGSVPLHDLAYPRDAQKNIATRDKEVHLVRIHLEEDVAKSFHFENCTGIDFNRAGTPLMEIVTEPELNSPEEAFAFLTALKQILMYGDVSDADMEKGQLRCDCNVSVRPESQTKFGAKIEIKNLNSISGVRRYTGTANAWLGRCRRRNLSHAHKRVRTRLSLLSRSRSCARENGRSRGRCAGACARVTKSKTGSLRRGISSQSLRCRRAGERSGAGKIF